MNKSQMGPEHSEEVGAKVETKVKNHKGFAGFPGHNQAVDLAVAKKLRKATEDIGGRW